MSHNMWAINQGRTILQGSWEGLGQLGRATMQKMLIWLRKIEMQRLYEAVNKGTFITGGKERKINSEKIYF